MERNAMDLRRLKHVVALADTLHFARAAEAVHLSQPAFSRSIQAIESDLGIRLFDRDSQLGDTAFGVGPLLTATLMPRALVALRRQHPQVALRMEVGNSVQLLESLRTESTEFFAADVRDMPRDAALDIQLIGGQPANLYVRAGHPLTGREHTLQEVWAYGLAVPMLLSPSTVELAALLGLPEGQEATIALECDNYGMLKTVALTTDTVLGATDAAVREELKSGALVRLVVQGWLSPPSSTGIVRLRGRTLSPAAKAAIAAIVRAAGEINV